MFILPALAWWGRGAVLNERFAAPIAMLSPLVVALNIIDRQSTWRSIVDLRYLHLAIFIGLSIVLLLVARVQLFRRLNYG
jgi:hypothetical protein